MWDGTFLEIHQCGDYVFITGVEEPLVGLG
jgi:hypothetical protein